MSLRTVIGLSLLAAGCGNGEWSWDEVARTAAPDGARDAVVIEQNGGAGTSFGYKLFVVPHGQRVENGTGGAVAALYAPQRNDRAYGVNIRWAGADTLVVEYLRAREAVVNSATIAGRRDRLRVVLRSGVTDPAAPDGGMLDSRKRAGGAPPNAR